MELIKDLENLKIGDWVKIYPKDENKRYFKIGEIIDKWKEKNHSCFELQITGTNLPLTTQKLIKKLLKSAGKFIPSSQKYSQEKCNENDRIFKLNKKKNILKKMIMENLE